MAKKTLEVEFRATGGAQVNAETGAMSAGLGKFSDRLARMLDLPTPDTSRQLGVLQRYADDITRIRERSAVDALRIQGRELDAELLQITQAAAAKKEAVERSLQRQVRNVPDEAYAGRLVESSQAKQAAIEEAARVQRLAAVTKAGEAEAAAQQKQEDRSAAVAAAAADKARQEYDRGTADFKAFLAERDQLQQAAAAQQAAARAGADRTLAAAREGDLGRRAAGGDDGAALELKRLAVQKQYTAEAEKLRTVMVGQGVSVAQRLAAEQALLKLEAAERAEMAKLTPEYVAQAKAEKDKADFAARLKQGGGGHGNAAGEDNSPDGGPGGGVIGRLRQRYGRRSALGQIGMVLQGGGAVGGITSVLSGTADIADRLRATQEERLLTGGGVRSGSSGGLAAAGAGFYDLAKALPISGEVLGAGERIRDAVESFVRPDATRERLLAPANAQRFNDLADARRQRAEQDFQARRATADYAADAGRTAGQAGLLGYSAQAANLANAAANEQRGIGEQHRDDRQKETEDYTNRSREIAKGPYSPEQAAASAELDRQHNERLAQIDADYATKAAAAARKNAAERLAFERNYQTQSERGFAEYAAQTVMITAQASAARLQEDQRGFAAQAEVAKAAFAERQRQQADQLAETLRNANPADRERIKQQAADRAKADQEAYDAARSATVTQAAREGTVGSLQDRASATGDALAGYEAQRVALIQQTTEKVNKLRDAWAQATTAEQRASLESSLQNYTNLLTKATDEQLRLGRRDVLGAEAGAGSKLAEIELRRVDYNRRLTEEMARQRAILAATVGVTPDQRKDAQDQLDRLERAKGGQVTDDVRQRQLALLQQQAQVGRTAPERRDARRVLAEDAARQGLKQVQAEYQAVLKQTADAVAGGDPAKRTQARQQRDAARADVQRFAEQAGRQYDQDVNGQPVERKRTFDPTERGLLLTGVTASAASRDPLEGAIRESVKAQNLTNDLLRQILAQNGPQAAGTNPPPLLFDTAN